VSWGLNFARFIRRKKNRSGSSGGAYRRNLVFWRVFPGRRVKGLKNMRDHGRPTFGPCKDTYADGAALTLVLLVGKPWSWTA